VPYFTQRTDPRLFKCPCQSDACDAPPPSSMLIDKLEELRAKVGLPLRVTSGPRCVWYNGKVGGVKNSAHLTGTAVDLACPNSFLRWQLLAATFRAPEGAPTTPPLFKRVGIGETFYHVDVSTKHPNMLVWHYYD
jgi:hypothetical protein